MNIGQRVCSLLMGPYKLHAALSVDVLYTKIHSDHFNGSEHPMHERKILQFDIKKISQPKKNFVSAIWQKRFSTLCFRIVQAHCPLISKKVGIKPE